MAELDAPRLAPADELGLARVRYDVRDAVATVTIDRLDVLNAFDFRTLREMAAAFEQAAWDDSVAAVVVTGAGDRAFSSGADLDEQAGMGDTSGQYWRWMGAFIEMHDRLRNIGKPTIARINGVTVGGGNEFNMACDLAIAAEHVVIRQVGTARGSVPAGGATQWLPVLVGERRAREIILLCDEIPAPQAEEWGLVNRSVPAVELDAAVDEYVDKLARKLPQTTRYAKQQLNFWRDLSWHETVNHARDWLALSMLGDEAQDAIRRFLERR